MSTVPDRQLLSRRRARRPGAAPAAVAPEAIPAPAGARWTSLVTLGILLAVLVAIGLGMQWALAPAAPKALARCHPATTIGPRQYAGPPAMCIDRTKTYVAHIQTTQGEFDVAMPAADAPTTVNNFVVLSIAGYYNGLRFFRTEDWVIQAGSPNNDGTGGPGYALAPEQAQNASWDPGAVGMARFGDGTISGGQFFIVRGSWPGDGPGNTVFNHFGTVLGGNQILSTLTSSDRVIGIGVSVQ